MAPTTTAVAHPCLGPGMTATTGMGLIEEGGPPGDGQEVWPPLAPDVVLVCRGGEEVGCTHNLAA